MALSAFAKLTMKTLQQVTKRLTSGAGMPPEINKAVTEGMKRAAEFMRARIIPLTPVDTANLMSSISRDKEVTKNAMAWFIRVGANATAQDGQSYAIRVHENMDYDGPNVGGARTQRRGPLTLKKPRSPIVSSDGAAGGKYMERVVRNEPQRYNEIVQKQVKKATK